MRFQNIFICATENFHLGSATFCTNFSFLLKFDFLKIQTKF